MPTNAKHLPLLTLSFLLLTVTGSPAPASAGAPAEIHLTLKDATPAEAAKALSEALGVEVVTVTAEGPRVSLQLAGEGPLEALNRVATAFRGRWRSVYHVRPAAGATVSPPPFATGRRVTLHVQSAAAGPVLAAVALADGGILATPPPADAPRIDVDLENVPVEAGMDRVAAELGLAWTRSFEILPETVIPVTPRGATTSEAGHEHSGGLRPGAADPRTEGTHSSPGPTNPTLYPLAGAQDAAGSAPRRTGAHSDLARVVADGLTRVMQMDPRARRPAIRQFAQQLETRLREINDLPAAERAQQRERLDRVYHSSLRLYRGLTPDQQQEFRPLFDVLRRWLGG